MGLHIPGEAFFPGDPPWDLPWRNAGVSRFYPSTHQLSCIEPELDLEPEPNGWFLATESKAA